MGWTDNVVVCYTVPMSVVNITERKEVLFALFALFDQRMGLFRLDSVELTAD